MKYLENLNENQKKAVLSTTQNIRVIAGAGSGKTSVLTTRIVDLICQKKVFPFKILSITFTNKAAKEMKSRVLDHLDEQNKGVRISTFHSFCAYFLRVETLQCNLKKDFNIIDEDDKKSLLKKLIKENMIDKKEVDVKSLTKFISNQKTFLMNQSEKIEFVKRFEKEEPFVYLANKYQDALKSMNSLDFDDLLLYTYFSLKKNKDLRKKWSNKYSHILIDEFQDTNDLQYGIVKFISKEDTSIFVVGDPDQTIYTWRGANHNIIMNFKKDFKSVETIVLDKNYRSSKAILDCANKLISYNENRVEKDLVTDNEKGEKVFYKSFHNQKQEARSIAILIKDYIENAGFDYKDIAILYRANYLSGEIEKQLQNYRIPYKIFGGLKFFARKEIKDVIAYLKLLINKEDDISFLRVINTPKREIGQVTMDKISLKANKENKSLYNTLKENIGLISRLKARKNAKDFFDVIEKYSSHVEEEVLVSSFIEQYLDEVNYFSSFDNENKEERRENVFELFAMITEFEKEKSDVNVSEFLQEVSLATSQDEIEDANYVSLMTVHTAKGLEYPIVFLAGLNEGVFPSIRSLQDNKEEEERRLAYVAFTRAKQRLVITSNNGASFIHGGFLTPSRFLQEANLMEFNESNYVSENKTKETIKKEVVKETNNLVFTRGEKIKHQVFGFGIVIDVEDKFIKVAFKDSKVGTKKLLSSHKFIEKG